ncbi:histidine kinase [Nonomuraea sp. NBC_01738]|uniref:sensor histidine kinase n=1 Tax=Nonomuraea sp. NBC_01738 TaxID=2976003 RepID=UPI002E0F0B73|nr:histidine kinase [Nonomuraea sp. NBC_01738]
MNRLRRQSKRQVVYDVLLWAGLSVLAATAGPDPLADPGGFLLVTGARALLIAVAVLVGRAWPLAALLITTFVTPWSMTASFATSSLVWPPGIGTVKILPAASLAPGIVWYAYLAGRRAVRWWPGPAAFAAVTVAGGVLVTLRGGGLGLWITLGTALLGYYAVPYLLGSLRRRLLQRTQEARRSVADQARLRERTRIAHDMHDSLGHDLALIAVRAAGLELSPGLAPAQVKAAGELREAAADATERLRQIIGLLRDQDDAPPLAPVGEGVTEVVERARASGMTITLDVTGAEPGLAHRVVQEGLTNAAKHAPGAPVEVTVSLLRVSVRNAAPHRRPTALSGGMGLAGLAERVRLAGGVMTAGPSGDGYELIVDLTPESVPRAGEADPRDAGGTAAAPGPRSEHDS